MLTRAAVARRRRRGSSSRRPAAAAGSRRWTAGSGRRRRPAEETSTTTTRACRRASTCRRRTSAIHDIPASSTQPASVSRPPGWPAGRRTRVGNESAPIQLAQCWFTGLAISNAKIYINFSDTIYGSNFTKQHSETVMFEISKMLINLLCRPGKAGLYSAYVSCLFFNDFCQTNYFNIFLNSLHQICRVGGTVAVDERSDVSFYRAMRPRYMLWPCVCLSVTSRSSTKTAKRRITQTTPHDSPGTLVF